MSVRILVADDHKLVRTALTSLLSGVPEFEIVADAGDGHEAVQKAIALKPDIVLMDVSMPRLDGVRATRKIAQQLPGVRVIGVSMHDSEEMRQQMLSAGAAEFVTKGGDVAELIATIREVAGM